MPAAPQKLTEKKNILSKDIFSYNNDLFYEYIKQAYGNDIAELFSFQAIRNAGVLLDTSCEDILLVLQQESDGIDALKKMSCFEVAGNKYQVKLGVKLTINNLIQSLNVAPLNQAQTQDTVTPLESTLYSPLTTNTSPIQSTSTPMQRKLNELGHTADIEERMDRWWVIHHDAERACLEQGIDYFLAINKSSINTYTCVLSYNFHLQIPERWSWFFMSGQQILLFMQDPIHVATKFRNRLLSEIASMKMGDYHVSIEHLINLIESKNKIEHNLIKSDICPKDRQNYASCRRISSELILQLLNKMEDCKGTYIYLSLLRSIIAGLIEKSTTIQERLYHVCSVVFTCRLWWTWLQYSKLKINYDDNDHETIDNIKVNSFITKPTFWCIEINAYTLRYIVLLVIKRKLPVDALNSYLFNSQTYENTFRIARCYSAFYCKKCEKISIINSIKSRGGQIGKYHLKFPQHHKLEKETEAHNYSINPIQQLNLTESDIEKIIESAFESAKQNIEIVNMTQLLKNEHKYSISELSQYIKTNISKSASKVIDYTKGFDFDDESDEDNLQDDENDSSMSDDIDQISANRTDEEEEENLISSDLSEVERQTFHGCRIYDKINPQQSKKYFRIYTGSSLKHIHKQTACWMFIDNRNHLSSDRLVRVRTSEM
ncbi:unnamed protein product [Rotaria socialis]